MSFKINNIDLEECYFNRNFVRSIYYNNELVWAYTAWPGWDNADWVDIYNLCKAKQTGAITEWPSDIYLGREKTAFCPMPTNNGWTTVIQRHPVILVGIDIDGDGVLTFETKHCFTEKYAGENAYQYFQYEDSGYGSPGDEVYIEHVGAMAQYVKPLKKQRVRYSWDAETENWIEEIYTEELRSFTITAAERGVILDGVPALYTEGVSKPYPYFKDANSRKKGKPINRSFYNTEPVGYYCGRDGTFVSSTGAVVDSQTHNEQYGDEVVWGHYAFAIG